jgi:hypothetical protein
MALRPQIFTGFAAAPNMFAIDMPPGIRIDDIGKDQTLDDLFEAGKLDAVALTSPPRAFLQGSPIAARLFPDCRAIEAEYYRRTKNLSDYAHDGDAPGDLRTRPFLGGAFVPGFPSLQAACI